MPIGRCGGRSGVLQLDGQRRWSNGQVVQDFGVNTDAVGVDVGTGQAALAGTVIEEHLFLHVDKEGGGVARLAAALVREAVRV